MQMMTMQRDLTISREVGDGEVEITLTLDIYEGARATRTDPEEEPTFEVLSARDEGGNEVELTKAEVEGIELLEVIQEAYDERSSQAEDAWEARREG